MIRADFNDAAKGRTAIDFAKAHYAATGDGGPLLERLLRSSKKGELIQQTDFQIAADRLARTDNDTALHAIFLNGLEAMPPLEQTPLSIARERDRLTGGHSALDLLAAEMKAGTPSWAEMRQESDASLDRAIGTYFRTGDRNGLVLASAIREATVPAFERTAADVIVNDFLRTGDDRMLKALLVRPGVADASTLDTTDPVAKSGKSTGFKL